MESIVEKMERSLLELRKENQIRLDEIKRLWKRRKGDYSRRQPRRDHAPSRRCRNTTTYAAEEKNEEIGVDLKLQNSESCSELGNQMLLLEAMDSNLPKIEAKEEEKEDEGKRSERFSSNTWGNVTEPEKHFEGDELKISEGEELVFPSPTRHETIPEQDGFKRVAHQFSDDNKVKVTTAAVPEPDPHHCGVASLQSDQTGATVRSNQRHRAAVVQTRANLEPPKPLEAKTRKTIVCNLHVQPPEPPDSPDRSALVVEVEISHGWVTLLLPAAEEYGRDERAKEIRAEGKLGRVDLASNIMDPTQTSTVHHLKQHDGPELKTENQAQFLANEKQAQKYGKAQSLPTYFRILGVAESKFSHPLFRAPKTGDLKSIASAAKQPKFQVQALTPSSSLISGSLVRRPCEESKKFPVVLFYCQGEVLGEIWQQEKIRGFLFDPGGIYLKLKLDGFSFSAASGQTSNLKNFVDQLSLTKRSSVPGSLVFWSDSITIDGKLNWQGQLNEYDKPLLDISDGIFVNYTWKENYQMLSSAVAGDQKFNAHMGIDEFERNTCGGGQWNVNVAMNGYTLREIHAVCYKSDSDNVPSFWPVDGKLLTAIVVIRIRELFEVAEFTAGVKYNKLEHPQLLFLKLHGVGRNVHEFHGGKPALDVEIQTQKLR